MPPPPEGPTYTPPLERCTIEDQTYCWEPWATVYNENHPWKILYDEIPYTLTLSDAKLTFSQENNPNMLLCHFPSNRWPLLNEHGQHLWFDARCVSTSGDLHYHYIVYHLFLRYWVQERILEPLISRGDHWGPIPMQMHNDALKTVWDYGLGPAPFDVYELWKWAQEDAGQSTDPRDWHLYYVSIALEESQPSGFMQVINDYVHLTFDLKPLPSPPSPIKNWLITCKTHLWSQTGKTITLQTDVPCHLFLRYQCKAPKWHDRLTVRRGVEDWRDPHWGFDEYTELEQKTAGDTYGHIFDLDPWPACDEIWYYFVGTILGVESPSVSPFYSQTRGLLVFQLLHFEPWGWWPEGPPDMHLLFSEIWAS